LGEPLSGETSLRGALANPCRGSAVIGFTLGQESLATFSVFDLSGRVVDERRGQFPMGESEITMSEVRPGIYFVRMTAGDFSATRRFVVME
ncbi:T9SS type A sorting domain-containing protein, partial [Candidatus Fermentibacterales bacterium]|nr:T9SS type A sorting domain-containing protein [Candidatus Fermentibacterales bacterium]